jgi:hypothetical protein
MATLQKLLKYPHKDVFDTSPYDQMAFRLRNPLGSCSWSVSNEALSVSDGVQLFNYSLPELSIAELIVQLQTDGFEVGSVSSDFLDFNSTVLTDGLGNQNESGFLYGFTNLIYAFFGAYSKELKIAKKQIDEAIKQMVISSAEGEWLDLWGNLYNHKRSQNQIDIDYSNQIPKEAFRERVNAFAIEQAIFDETGKRVIIEEPWGEMFRLDDSELSGTKKLYNGEKVGYHLIRPVSLIPLDWSDVIPIIMRNKASGIIVLDAEIRPSTFVDASIDGTVLMGIQAQHSNLVKSADDCKLSDNLVLSESQCIRNYYFGISSNGTYVNGRNFTWQDGGWDNRQWNDFVFDSSSPHSASMLISQRLGYTWVESGIWSDINWLGN